LPDAPTIVFVRHGETDWNVAGRLQGQRDVPMNEKGRDQARRNGRIIAERLPEAVAYDFVASPLIRARETMEIVRATMGLDPEAYRIDERLREIAYGDWEGWTLAELRVDQPERMAAREADKWMFLPPAGESYEMLSERVANWLATVTQPTVVAAHGGVGRVLLGEWDGLAPAVIVTTDFPQDQIMLWRDGKVSWL